ncbi:SDR family oxidoreductase [Rhizobium sp. NFR07]|uniref:SDR family oxidoreductase n=1 Tax=Rhizobium sp. NFR07 TaxID=1566262 RepID=UPI00244E67F6|nr:SDR family oxidoreductase [Rhizobium sp. NFR07]
MQETVMKLFSLVGDVAFVTGAGSGIGQAIAIGLAEAGADVALFDLSANGLAETLDAVKAHGRKGFVFEGSVADEKHLAAAVEGAEKELGALTVAVNSAGIANAMPAEDMPRERWQQMLDVNLTGVFLSCQAEARVMLPRKKGSIVNIASMSGSIVNRGLSQAHYNTSKAGVIHLSKSLAMEWVEQGLRVNAISPGYTLSPMNKRPEVADQLKIFQSETPMARIATVDEMVGPAVFLSSAAASFITGHDLLVDGGFTAW